MRTPSSVRNSVRIARWNRSILPVVVGRTGLGQQMLDAVLTADPVEQRFHRRLVEPAGEHLSVIGQDLLRAAVGAQRCRQSCAHPAGGLPFHQPGAHTEPGVIIHPGQRLGPGCHQPARTRRPRPSATTPSESRVPSVSTSDPAAVRAPPDRSDSAPYQRPVGRRLRNRRHDPSSAQSQAEPTRTPRRMRQPQLNQRDLNRCRHLVRTGTKDGANRRLIPPAHRPRTWPATRAPSCAPPQKTAAATSVTVSPSAITARTASYRCSATDNSRMIGSVTNQPK